MTDSSPDAVPSDSSKPLSSSPHPPSPTQPSTDTIGLMGEQLVAQLLKQQGWHILEHRWRCRWGELDLIAKPSSPHAILRMVEVKVRGQGNWDDNGRFAVTARKRIKLIRAATLFLAQRPTFQDYECHFDLALVTRNGMDELWLHEYLEDAFEISSC